MAAGAEHRRAPGRPRDGEVGPAILGAARRLVLERGYEAVTTRMIAQAAGAGKEAIYRRWPSKAELVLEAFLAYAQSEVDAPRRGPAPLRDQVADFLRRTFVALVVAGPAVRGLMATAQRDTAFRASFRARLIEPRRAALCALLRTATADGRLPADADVDVATISLFGAVWYRLLLDEPMDDRYPERLADIVVGGLEHQAG